MCLGICIEAGCCCCKACCNDACKLFKRSCNISIRQQVRFCYLLLSFFTIIATILIVELAPQFLSPFTMFIHCPQESGGDLMCLGVSLIYRVSFSLTMMYLLVGLICLFRDQCARFMNENCWCLKIFLIMGLTIGMMFVTDDFFVVWVELSKWFGGFFLVFQVIMLIDLFYLIGEKMVALYDNGYEIMKYVLIALALVEYGLTIYLITQNFNWFPCSQTNHIISIIIVAVITILTVSGIAKNGSLITSGAMSLYITYQFWSALTNEKDKQCNQWNGDDTTMKLEFTFGFIFIIMALMYVTFNSGEGVPKNGLNQSTGIIDRNAKDSDEDDSDFLDSDYANTYQKIEMQKLRENNKEISDQQLIREVIEKERANIRSKRIKDYQNNNYLYFHLIMMCSSIYLTVLMTNWGAPVVNSRTWNQYLPSDTSKWIKLGSGYIASLFYIWTLIAPRIFPDRFE